MKFEKSCGCVVLNDKQQVLLVHHNLGHWGLPKGHVEKDETEVETAKREVKEETNIDVEVNSNYRYSMSYSPKEGIMKEVVFFVANSVSNNLKEQVEEVQEVKWFDFDDAINAITYDNSKELLRKVKFDLQKNKKGND